MAKRHYIPVTADVPGVSDEKKALIRRVIRTALAMQGVDFPCEVDVLVTSDAGIHQINLDMRQVDRPTDVLSFPEFELTPGELPDPEDADPRHGTGAAGRHGAVHGAGTGTGQGVRALQPPGAGVSGGALGAASAGLRPSGRRPDEGPDAGTGGEHYGGIGVGEVRKFRGYGHEVLLAAVPKVPKRTA